MILIDNLIKFHGIVQRDYDIFLSLLKYQTESERQNITGQASCKCVHSMLRKHLITELLMEKAVYFEIAYIAD